MSDVEPPEQSNTTRFPWSSSISRLIAFATLSVIVLLSWKPWIATVMAGGRSDRVAILERAADVRDPEFVRFVERVRSRIEPGQSIVLAVPPESEDRVWYDYRAEWILAGIDVRPFLDPLGRAPSPDDLLLFWNVRPNLANLEIVDQEGAGYLLRVRR